MNIQAAVKRFLSILIPIAVPIVISMLAILVLLSPFFTGIEYRRPGFPEDSYGFSTAERLDYGNETRRYLVGTRSLEDLENLKFENGEPIYISRELSHLVDVKLVLEGLVSVFIPAAGLLILGGAAARVWSWREGFVKALSRGGKLTAGLLVLLLGLTLASFQMLFTRFHQVFFEGDSWLFSYSDTLIRLFPIQFWQDIFLVFGILTLTGGVLLGWILPAWLAEKSPETKQAA